MRDGQIEAMTVDQRSNDSAIDDFFGAAAMMRLGFPCGDRLVSLPITLDLQTFLVIRAAAMTMTDGPLVLKSPFLQHCESLFLFVQLQRGGIDTVTKIRRLWTVVEDMAQMSIAFAAENLGAAHKKAVVFFRGNILFGHGRRETRPTGSRVKFGIRAKEFITAAAATVNAFLVVIPVLPGKCGLCALLPSDVELFVRQIFLPFGFALFNLFHNHSPCTFVEPGILFWVSP
jgi:hypothetical protein